MKGFVHRDNVKVRSLEEELSDMGLNPDKVINEIDRQHGLLEQGPVPLPLGGLMEGDETPKTVRSYGENLIQEAREDLIDEAKKKCKKKESEGDEDDDDVMDEAAKVVSLKGNEYVVDVDGKGLVVTLGKAGGPSVQKKPGCTAKDYQAAIKAAEKKHKQLQKENLDEDADEPLIEKKWIQKAVQDPGRVREYLGVPEGKKIPMAKLSAAIEKLTKKENKTSAEKSLMSALLLAKRFKKGIEQENLDEGEELDEARYDFGSNDPNIAFANSYFGLLEGYYKSQMVKGGVKIVSLLYPVLRNIERYVRAEEAKDKHPPTPRNNRELSALFAKVASGFNSALYGFTDKGDKRMEKLAMEAKQGADKASQIAATLREEDETNACEEFVSDLLYLMDEGWEPLDEVAFGIKKKLRGASAKMAKIKRHLDYIKHRGSKVLQSKMFRKQHKRQIKRTEKAKVKKYGRAGLAKLHAMGRRIVKRVTGGAKKEEIELSAEATQAVNESAEVIKFYEEQELPIYTETMFYAAQVAQYLGEVFDALHDEAGPLLFEMSNKAVELAGTFSDEEPTEEQEKHVNTILESLIKTMEVYTEMGSPSLGDAIGFAMVEAGEAEWDDLFEYRPPDPSAMGFGTPGVKHGQTVPTGKTAAVDPSVAGKYLKKLNMAMQKQSIGDAIKAANEVAKKHTVKDNMGRSVKSVTDMKGVFKVMYYLSQATGLGAPAWMYSGKPKPWWLWTPAEKKASAELTPKEKEALNKKEKERRLDKEMVNIFKSMGAPAGFLKAMGEWIEEGMEMPDLDDVIAEMRAPIDKKLFKQVLDAAEKLTQFKKKGNAKGAVKKVISTMVGDTRFDLKNLEAHAVQALEQRWKKNEDTDDPSDGEEEPIDESWAPANRELLDKVVLMARNEGSFYKKRDAKGAVQKAIKYYTRELTLDLKADMKNLERYAIDQVTRLWKTEDVEPGEGHVLDEASEWWIAVLSDTWSPIHFKASSSSQAHSIAQKWGEKNKAGKVKTVRKARANDVVPKPEDPNNDEYFAHDKKTGVYQER